MPIYAYRNDPDVLYSKEIKICKDRHYICTVRKDTAVSGDGSMRKADGIDSSYEFRSS